MLREILLKLVTAKKQMNLLSNLVSKTLAVKLNHKGDWKMKNENITDKKAGKGNGNSVIDNHEYPKDSATNYVSGDSTRSSSSHNFSEDNK